MIYLNYAALSPTRAEAERAVEHTLNEFKQYLYSDAGIQWYLKKVHHYRNAVATLLHVEDPSTIAFVPNASTAHYLAITSLAWNPGDTILTSTHENPSITRQLRALAQRGVYIHTVRPSTPNDLVTTMKQLADLHRPKVIVVSHVSHVDGKIFPVQEIASVARDRNIVFMVDGAQAVGHIPVDLSQLDFDIYFFTGHKWCGGPLGTGALVTQHHFLELNPSFGVQAEEQGRARATQFEIGTHNIGLIAGLAKACELKCEEGLVTEQLLSFRATAKEALTQQDGIRILEWEWPHAPGILTFQGKSELDHGAFVKQLSEEWNIIVKPFVDYPEGDFPAIRLSWAPTMEDNNFRIGLEKIVQGLETSVNR